jgi:integrase
MEPTFLSADQIETLARATRQPHGLLVRLVAATGLRPSEVCGLRVGKVNLLRSTMEISEALTVVGGKTEVGPIKTYARRSVGITRSLSDDLGAHLASRAEALGHPLDPVDYVFTAPRGGPSGATCCSSGFYGQPSRPPTDRRLSACTI